MALVNHKAFATFLCVMLLAHAMATTQAAITCGAVSSALAPCMGYLMGQTGPSMACCSGVKSLVSMTSNPDDKKGACQCMKSSAGSIQGIHYDNAAALPSQCGVNLPFKITPTIDCNTLN